MITYVVTGGICSGKSTFCNLINDSYEYASYISSDEIVSEMYQNDNIKKKY